MNWCGTAGCGRKTSSFRFVTFTEGSYELEKAGAILDGQGDFMGKRILVANDGERQGAASDTLRPHPCPSEGPTQ